MAHQSGRRRLSVLSGRAQRSRGHQRLSVLLDQSDLWGRLPDRSVLWGHLRLSILSDLWDLQRQSDHQRQLVP